ACFLAGWKRYTARKRKLRTTETQRTQLCALCVSVVLHRSLNATITFATDQPSSPRRTGAHGHDLLLGLLRRHRASLKTRRDYSLKAVPRREPQGRWLRSLRILRTGWPARPFLPDRNLGQPERFRHALERKPHERLSGQTRPNSPQ